MPNWTRYAVIAAVLIAVVGGGVFLYVTRDLEDASEDIQENTQQLETETETAAVFRISQAQSTATYVINEVLRGEPFTVVGTTNEVAGDILVDFGDVSASEIGQIRINARTFATDDSRRDNAVGRMVLQAENDANEFIEFVPSAITGLPDAVEIGDRLEFDISGDLTISGSTQPVTFAAVVTYVQEDEISGTAEVTIAYADFNLTIPNVPVVSSVEETVILRLDFVAERVDEAATEATEEPDA